MAVIKKPALQSQLEGSFKEQSLAQSISYIEGGSLLAKAGSKLNCSVTAMKYLGIL